MRLSDLSVRRPVLATVLSLLIMTFGVLSFQRLPLREYPDIDTPLVSVETNYRGASAAVIESRITQVIEDRLSGIEGIRAIESDSRDGRSSINVEFEQTRDIDDAANDVRDRVAASLAQLPDDVDLPLVSKVDSDAQPIMAVGVSSDTMSYLDLSDYVDRFIIDRFSTVDGVARASAYGMLKPSMRIWLDRRRLAAFSLTIEDVERALRTQNVELPAGRLESRDMNLTVRVVRPYRTADEFSRLVVARGDNGYLVRLGDIARVERGPEDPYSLFTGDGRPMVGIAILRASKANTVAIARAVRATVDDLQASLPKGTRLVLYYDSALFIEEAVRQVYQTLGEATVLVILVIFVFLGSARATLIPAVAVPVSLFGIFIGLAAFGYTINLLTLLALVLAIGLVVDDAIVVLENVHHRIEQGESPLVAAYLGTAQVGFAVIASSLVVVAVFVPVIFISGITGKLFAELAVAMIGAMLVSMLVSLTLTPALCSLLLKPGANRGGLTERIDVRFRQLSALYSRALAHVMAHGWIAALLLVVSVLLILGLGARMPGELSPPEDTGIIFTQTRMPEGTGFEAARRAMMKADEALMPMLRSGDSVEHLFTRVPVRFGSGEEYNQGLTILILKPWGERDEDTAAVVKRAQAVLDGIPEFRAFPTVRNGLVRSRGRPVQFVIAGSSYDELARARDAILRDAEANPGLIGVDADYRETKPQLQVDIDTTRAADLGVPIETIGRTLETMLGAREITTYVDRGEEYKVMVQAQHRDRMLPADLLQIYVRSAHSGRLVPLANLVTVRTVADAGTLSRYNKMRAITIQAGLAPGYSLGEALAFLQESAARHRSLIAGTGYKGESREFMEARSSLYLMLGLSILVIFLVLSAQFESFLHPVTILLTVPLGLGGAILGLWLTGGTINIYSQIGMVMLVGLAAKNGVLIVEFANQLRDQGHDIAGSVVQAAARRFRPVLMTSIATIAGAMPLALAHGAGAGARQAIGIVIVFGVLFSSVLTLFVIPVAYRLWARYTRSPQAVSQALEAALGDSASGRDGHV